MRATVSVSEMLTHSSVSCAPAPLRPEQHGRDAGSRDEARVGPVARTFDRRRHSVERSGRAYLADDLRIRLHLERLARQQRAALDRELGVRDAASFQERFELASTSATLVPGNVRRSIPIVQRAG